MRIKIKLGANERDLLAHLKIQHGRCFSELSGYDRWNISKLLGRKITDDNPATFEEMLPLWVGGRALKNVSTARRQQYVAAIEAELDFPILHEVLEELEAEYCGLPEWALSSVYSLALLKTLIGQLDTCAVYKVVEVGGGFGLLASYALRFLSEPIHYTLVDAISESLVYSHSFLSNKFEGKAQLIEQPLQNKPGYIDIIPAWHSRALDIKGNIIINISSLQEMPDETAHAYLSVFDDWTEEGAGIIFVNSRDFFYTRKYKFPDSYQRLLMLHSPRSRTLDFPIEIFKKTNNDHNEENSQLELDYYWNLKIRAQDEVKRLKRNLIETQLRLNQRIENLSEQRDDLRDALVQARKL